MLLVAYKLAEFIRFLAVGALAMALVLLMACFLNAASFEEGRGRVSWVWTVPTFLWASWKVATAGITLLCVRDHLDYYSCSHLHKMPHACLPPQFDCH